MKFRLKRLLVANLMLLSVVTFAQNSSRFKVVLDAGHGDHDPGAQYHGFIEKNITLAVVLKLGKILENDPQVDVTYTRTTDVFVDLVERANVANRIHANFFVSVHCNANKNTKAYGAETFVMGLSKNASNLEVAKKENSVITLEDDYKTKYAGYDPNSPEKLISATIDQEEYQDQSIELASKIQNCFDTKLGRKVRGITQAPFMVLHKAYMPRVLIEIGFISNLDEGNYLNSEDGQENIAKAIAEAIFKMKVEHFGGSMPVIQIDRSVKPIIIEAPKTEPKVITTPVESVPSTNNKVIFKVQVNASSDLYSLKSENFKGLDGITYYYERNSYKYMYGETFDYPTAKKLLKTAKSKGYDSAFIVAFKKGLKISLNEAFKSN
jgi:N-acetylmuramoyl-L-alanine amidase